MPVSTFDAVVSTNDILSYKKEKVGREFNRSADTY
jgi:hypothetical protein